MIFGTVSNDDFAWRKRDSLYLPSQSPADAAAFGLRAEGAVVGDLMVVGAFVG